jgi:dihydrofolate reductase
VTECHITEIQASFEGDAWFAPLDIAQWRETAREKHAALPPSDLAYDTVVYRRSSAVAS